MSTNVVRIPILEGLFGPSRDGDGPVLLGSRCDECGNVAFPSTISCPACVRGSCTIIELPRRGEVEFFVVVHYRSADYLGERLPYAIGVVRLGDVISIEAPLDCEPERVRNGLAVEFVIGTHHLDEEGRAIETFFFRPVDGGDRS